MEVETLLIVAMRVELLRPSDCGPALDLCEDVSRMLTALLRKLEHPPITGQATKIG